MRLQEAIGDDLKSIMRRYNTALTVGGLTSSALAASSLLGLPVPAAIGVSAIAGAHLGGAVYDLYRNTRFKQVYQKFMGILEKREVIITTFRRFDASFRVGVYQAIRKEMKAIEEDIRHYGGMALKMVERRIKSDKSETRMKFDLLRDQIEKAIKRKVTLTEEEETALMEVLAPVVLTARIIKKIRDSVQTKRHINLLRKVSKGESTKYTVDEVLSMLAVDFVRDYRIGLVTGEEFASLTQALVTARDSGGPQSLINTFDTL